MKKISVFLISAFFFFQTSLLAYSSDPKDFVKELVNEAIEKLSDKNIDDNEKIKFIEQVALDNVDINALGLYTLGELRKSSNKQVVIKYQVAFEKYFIEVISMITKKKYQYYFKKMIKVNKFTELLKK